MLGQVVYDVEICAGMEIVKTILLLNVVFKI